MSPTFYLQVLFQALEQIKSREDLAVDGCHYELIREDRYRVMKDFFRIHFITDETINKSLNIPWDEEYEALYTNILAHNLSIALVSSKTGEIVGGRIIIIANKNDRIDATTLKSEPLKKLIDITYHFDTLCDMFQHYRVDEMIHFFRNRHSQRL